MALWSRGTGMDRIVQVHGRKVPSLQWVLTVQNVPRPPHHRQPHALQSRVRER